MGFLLMGNIVALFAETELIRQQVGMIGMGRNVFSAREQSRKELFLLLFARMTIVIFLYQI